MFKKLLKSPWTGTVFAVGSVVWEAALLLGAPIGLSEKDRRSYLVYGLGALLICMGQAFYALISERNQLSRRLTEIEEATPLIRPKAPGAVHCIQVWQGPNIRVPFLRVRFWNDPPASHPKAVGKGVRAFVRFFPSGHGVSSLEIPGRWSESDQPDVTKPHISTAPLEETTFGFGESKTVDIAYISSVDGGCYAWNNENYKYPQFQNPSHLLNELGYTVDVLLRGEMLDATFRFTFHVTNGTFKFTQPLSVPCIRGYQSE